MKPEPNPFLPRVDLTRLRRIVDVGQLSPPAPPIVTHTPHIGAGTFVDSDRDGVPDMFDCAPLDPAADGWLGDTYKAAKKFFTPDYSVAASRRASVRQAASGVAARAAAVVRRAPPSPTRYVAGRVSAAVSRRAAPMVKRIVSRPSPADLKRVTAAAFPKTATTIRAAAELQKAVAAVRPPSRAELVQAGITAFPTVAAGVAAGRAVVGAKPVVAQALPPIDYERAAQRRAAVRGAGWGAPKQVLAGIAEMGEPFRGRMESQIAAVTARQQAKFPEGTISPESRWFAEKTKQVAETARGFEQPVERRMLAAEEFLGLHSERIPESLRWVGGQVKRFGYGVAFTGTAGAAEMGGMVPVAVETMVRRPEIIPAAVGVGLVTMGKGMYHGATTDPVRMGGEFLTFGALVKAPAYSPVKFKPTLIKFPGAKGLSIGMETRKGSVTKFRPGISIIPSAKKPITGLKTPKLTEAEVLGVRVAPTPKTPQLPVFTPKTAFESQIVAKSLGREGAKITEARAVRWETTRAKVTLKEITPAIKEVLKEHDLSASSASIVRKTIKSHKGTLYGSIIQRAAGERGLMRVPRDFDVMVKNPVKFAKDVATRINKSEGRQVVVAKEGMVTVRATGKKLFDIHAPDTSSSYFSRTEVGWGLIPEKLVKVEGVRMRSFGEQMSRKLEGGMMVGQKRTLESPLGSVTGRIVPKHKGRIKDILDFYTGEKLSIERLRAQGKTKSATKADTHLERWLNTWGEELAATIRQISKEQIETGVVTEFAFDFGVLEPTAAKLTTYQATTAAAYTPTQYTRAYSPLPPGTQPYTPPISTPSSTPPSVQPYRPLSTYKPYSVALHPQRYIPPAQVYIPPSTPPQSQYLFIPLSVPPSAPQSTPPTYHTQLPSTLRSAPPSVISIAPSVLPSVPTSPLPSTPLSVPLSVPPSPPPSEPLRVSPVPPSVPPKIPPLRGEDKDERRRKVRGKHDPFAWAIENPLITLDEFFANPPQPKKPVKPKNMIPTIPAGVV